MDLADLARWLPWVALALLGAFALTFTIGFVTRVAGRLPLISSLPRVDQPWRDGPDRPRWRYANAQLEHARWTPLGTWRHGAFVATGWRSPCGRVVAAAQCGPYLALRTTLHSVTEGGALATSLDQAGMLLPDAGPGVVVPRAAPSDLYRAHLAALGATPPRELPADRAVAEIGEASRRLIDGWVARGWARWLAPGEVYRLTPRGALASIRADLRATQLLRARKGEPLVLPVRLGPPIGGIAILLAIAVSAWLAWNGGLLPR